MGGEVSRAAESAPCVSRYAKHSYSGYQSGCRCEGCRAASREYRRRWRSTKHGKDRVALLAKVERIAFTRLRDAHPEEYERYYKEAYAARRPERAERHSVTGGSAS